MRAVLRVLGTRYGSALTLVVLVVMVVVAFRGFAGTRGTGPIAPALEPSHAVSVDPSGDDGLADNADDDPGATQPSLAASATAAVTTAAGHFTTAWLKHTGVTGAQWRAGLTPYATTTLMAKFQDTDPATVPANATTGPATLVVRDPTLVEATTPLDNGTLRLGLIVVSGHWKVDTVNWERPS